MDRLFVAYALTLISTITLHFIGAIGDTFDVTSYGAAGDGNTDDSVAFMKAWTDTCSSVSDTPTMLIPSGKTFLVKPITIPGPCKTSKVNIMIAGTINAPSDPNQWQGLNNARWIVFSNVVGLKINGGGNVDGQGKAWWDISCRYHPGDDCVKVAPTNVEMDNLHITNSAQTHILLEKCESVQLTRLVINSPDESPNTDGIHISNSQGVGLTTLIISSGDDCVSIGDHTKDINVTHLTCGPGHGISIGSLGKDGNEVDVENIFVREANFTQTNNGARIKTWQTGSGHVRNVEFSHLTMTSVKNPMVIDQFYCDSPGACPPTTTGVQLSDIKYRAVTGTSVTDTAITFNCSSNVPCNGIVLDTIRLTSDAPGKQVMAACNNARGVATGTVEPASCLQS